MRRSLRLERMFNSSVARIVRRKISITGVKRFTTTTCCLSYIFNRPRLTAVKESHCAGSEQIGALPSLSGLSGGKWVEQWCYRCSLSLPGREWSGRLMAVLELFIFYLFILKSEVTLKRSFKRLYPRIK